MCDFLTHISLTVPAGVAIAGHKYGYTAVWAASKTNTLAAVVRILHQKGPF